MLIPQEKIEDEMRKAAMEFMLCKVVAAVLGGRTAEETDAGLMQIAEHAKSQVFPGFDPAQSDHVSAEYALAIRRLCEMASKISREVRPQKTKTARRPRK